MNTPASGRVESGMPPRRRPPRAPRPARTPRPGRVSPERERAIDQLTVASSPQALYQAVRELKAWIIEADAGLAIALATGQLVLAADTACSPGPHGHLEESGRDPHDGASLYRIAACGKPGP